MDPQVQAQIPQIPGQVPTAQVPQQANPYAVMGAPVPGQYIMPPQAGVPQMGVPMQVPVQQVAPAPQQDSFFDKLLKGIVDFIGKSANPVQTAPAPQGVPMQGVPMQPGQAMPGQYAAPQMTAPVGAVFGQIGNMFESVANGMQNVATQAVQAGQDFVVQQPVQPTVDPQQLLQQQYQAYPQQPVMQQPVQQAVVPQVVAAPQAVAPVVQPIPQVAAPVAQPAPQAPTA